MTLNDPKLFLNQASVLFDAVGADGMTILCVVMASLMKDGHCVYLISPTETVQKFKMLLRKLNAPDLTLLEAQGKFKFSSQVGHKIDRKYLVIAHSANFLPVADVCGLVERGNILLHVHKDMDSQLVKYLIGACNLVIDLSPLASGYSQQIFGRLAFYPGGQYHAIVKEAKQYTVSVQSDTSVTLVDA